MASKRGSPCSGAKSGEVRMMLTGSAKGCRTSQPSSARARSLSPVQAQTNARRPRCFGPIALRYRQLSQEDRIFRQAFYVRSQAVQVILQFLYRTSCDKGKLTQIEGKLTERVVFDGNKRREVSLDFRVTTSRNDAINDINPL